MKQKIVEQVWQRDFSQIYYTPTETFSKSDRGFEDCDVWGVYILSLNFVQALFS